MNEQIITTTNISTVKITIEPSALARKREILAVAQNITDIKTPADCELAAASLRDVSGFLKELEAARKEAKAPILKMGKDVDGIADKVAGDLNIIKNALSLKIGAYNAEQARIQREAEEKARVESERIRKEEEERLRKAEEERKAAEAALTQGGESFEEFCAAQEKLDAANNAKLAAELNLAAPVEVVVPKLVKVAGVRTQTYRKFEVVDAAALLATHPELFMPNESAIGAFVKGLPSASETVAGLRIWEETKSSAF